MNTFWLKYLPRALRNRLDGRQGLQQAIGNSGWLLFDKVIRVATGLVIGIWMARALGPEQFGLLNYAFALVALFTPIATLGLDGIVVRNLVTGAPHTAVILGSAAGLKLVGVLVAFVLCNLAMRWIEAENPRRVSLVWIVSLGLLYQMADVMDCWFQSEVASKYVVLAKLPALLVFTGVRIALILSGASLLSFAWVQSFELLLAALGVLAMYRSRRGDIGPWQVDWEYARSLLREAWPLVLAGLSVILYMRVDIVMLEKMVGDHAAGIYSAATRLSEGFYFVPMIVVSSLAPMLIKARSAGQTQYRAAFFKLYVLMARLSLLITVAMAILSPWLVELLFGDDYAESAAVLQVHVWALVAVSLGVASSQYLTIEGMQTVSLSRTVLGLLLNVVLNLVLIPHFGAMGAATATLISYFVSTFSLVYSRRTRSQGRLMLLALSPGMISGLRSE